MTIWIPDISQADGPRYLAIAQAIAAAIETGELAPEEKLPTHRELAYQLGVTVGTITRAYKEAERQGHLIGEVGRGTFVRSVKTAENQFAVKHRRQTGLIDMSLNFPPDVGRTAAFAETLKNLSRSNILHTLLDYHPAAGMAHHRLAGAEWMSSRHWKADPEEVLVTNGGQHSIATVLLALTKPGDTLLCEEFTYPVTKVAAQELGLKLHGLAMDDQGLIPKALDTACRADGARVLYCMPSFHNPSGIYMPEERRRQIAEVAKKHDLLVIDDDVFGNLHPDPAPPLSAFIPDNACYVVSAKHLAPGLRIGFLRVPSRIFAAVETAIRTTCWMAPPFMAEVMTRWIEDGTASKLVSEQCKEAARRQQMAEKHLARHGYHAPERGPYHLWLPLPAPWREDRFVALARERGVALIGSDTFAAPRRQPAHAVRICLGCTHDRDRVEKGLEIIAQILDEPPRDSLAVV